MSNFDVPSAAAGGARRRRSWLLAAAALAAAGTLAYLGSSYLGGRAAPDASPPPAPFTARRTVAVLGFENLAGRGDVDWLSTAIAEMLTTELGIGGEVRVISRREVARVRRQLALEGVGELTGPALGRLRRQLGAELLVEGSYSFPGGGESAALRVELRLRDAATGEVVASSGGEGGESQLFEILAQAGGDFRRWFELGELTPGEALAVRATLPADPRAARLYSEGLAALRGGDSLAARRLLEQAAAVDGEHPLIHTALARAFSNLGDDERARHAARTAAELVQALPDRERRGVEAFALEVERKWDEAVAVYEALVRAYPDDVESRIRLADVLNSAARNREALVALEELRNLPLPGGDEARIDVVEAAAHYEMGDFEKARDLAARAARKAAALESDLGVALARLEETRALLDLGMDDEATTAIREARDLFAAAGEDRGFAEALELMALATRYEGDLTGARRLSERALATYREIGHRRSEARVLLLLGTFLLDQGAFAEAETFQFEALAILRQLGDKAYLANALIDVGIKFHLQGELERALESYQEALVLATEIGEKSRIATLLTNMAEISYLRGDLDEARRMHEDSSAVNREIGDQRNVAYDTFRLGKVLSAQGELAAAESLLREALAVQERMGETVSGAETRIALAEAVFRQDDTGEAEELARIAEEVLRSEEMTDLAALAQALLVRILLAREEPAAARETNERALATAAGSEDRRVLLAAATASALVRATVDGELEAALADLGKVTADAVAAGFAEYELEARLAAAEIAAAAGRAPAADLRALAEEAKARGYGSVAQRAAALAGG